MKLSSMMTGAMGACASFFGKMAFGNELQLGAEHWCRDMRAKDDTQLCYWVGCVARVLALGGMLICNASMTACFLRALHQDGSTAATVTSCCTNSLIAGLLGWLLLSEMLRPRWWLGAAFLVTGMALVGHAQTKRQEGEMEKKQKAR
ncbi:unnamed protein product [Chrysoparadoxa australica]